MASDAPGSGPDPDDFAPADGAEATPATGSVAGGSPARPPHKHGALRATGFLLAMLGTCTVAMPFLSWPLADLLARLLTAAGIRTPGPSGVSLFQWATTYEALPQTFLVQTVSMEVLLLALASAGAVFLGGGQRFRLGLLRPRGGLRVVVLALVVEFLGLLLGGAVALLFLPSDYRPSAHPDQFKQMIQQVSLGWWMALVPVVAVLPGLCEEMFFRGLIQRRLLLSWSPWAAIPVTGLVFAALHPPVGRGVSLLPVSLWIGYVAWRTDSILPGMFLHATANAAVQVLTRLHPVGAPSGALPSHEPPRSYVALLAAILAAICLWLLLLLNRWTSTRVSPAPAAGPTMPPDPNPGGP